VFDATGKLPPGVVKGNLQWLGNYRECINTKLIPGVNDTRRGFSGHYCSVAIVFQPAVRIPNQHHFFLDVIWVVFGLYFIIAYYEILNEHSSMCRIVVYSRGNNLQCSCDGTYAYHRVVPVLTLKLSPVVVCKSPVCFYVSCGVAMIVLD